MSRLIVSSFALLALGACVGYRPVPIAAPGIMAGAEGMEVRIESLACCARYRERFLEAVLSISNRRGRALIVSAADIRVVDARGATVAAAIGEMPRLGGRTWLFKPPEIIEFEKRWGERLSTEAVVQPGSTVQVRVFFRERVDFDRLTTLSVRSVTAGVTVELPLELARR